VNAVDTTKGVTIFAPVNDAFTKAGAVPDSALSNILTFHGTCSS
jgi:uncharacterized surface protein with fasciclin (FAS1) repeats